MEAATMKNLSPQSAGVEPGNYFFDTADMYGPHTKEQLLGRALAGDRARVVIATKFGTVRDPADPQKRGISGNPEYVRSACQ